MSQFYLPDSAGARSELAEAERRWRRLAVSCVVLTAVAVALLALGALIGLGVDEITGDGQ